MFKSRQINGEKNRLKHTFLPTSTHCCRSDPILCLKMDARDKVCDNRKTFNIFGASLAGTVIVMANGNMSIDSLCLRGGVHFLWEFHEISAGRKNRTRQQASLIGQSILSTTILSPFKEETG